MNLSLKGPMDIWSSLVKDLQHLKPLRVPRCYVVVDNVLQYFLLGFCDASQRAYVAVVYLFVQTLMKMKKFVSLLCSKTIPRLEL